MRAGQAEPVGRAPRPGRTKPALSLRREKRALTCPQKGVRGSEGKRGQEGVKPKAKQALKQHEGRHWDFMLLQREPVERNND